MSDVERHLRELLLAIVRAHRVTNPDGVRESLMFIPSFGGDTIKHRGWPDDGPPVGKDDLEELQERGFVRIDYLAHSWNFAPTSEAYEVVADYERAVTRAERQQAVDLHWSAVHPILCAVVETWERAGAVGHLKGPPLAAELDRPEDDPELATVIDLLAEQGWVEATYDQDSTLPVIRPTAKALAALRDWPGGDAAAAFEQIVARLERLAETTENEEDRKKLSRAREFLIDLTSATIASFGGQVLSGD